MAEISKQALKVDNNQSFPNNNNGAITPSILRAFNTNMIDSMVDEISYNVDSASWNRSISSLNQFTASAAGLTTGSLLVTASASSNVITFTKGDASTFNVTVADTTNLTPLNQFTASAQISLNNLNLWTSSYQPVIVNLQASQSINETKFATIGSQSGSWGTGTGGTISGSAQITALGFVSSSVTASSLVTASVNVNILTFTKGDGSQFNLTVAASGSVTPGTVSGSAQIVGLGFLQTSSFQTYTSSIDSKFISVGASTASLNLYTASQDTKNTTLASVTSSLNSATASLFTSASLGLVTASISGQLLTFTKGNQNQFTLNIPTGSGTYVTGSYGAFQDSTTQSGSANTAYKMKFNTTDVSDGVILSGSTGLKVGAYGTYDLQWSGQLNEGSGGETISIWISINGVDVVGSRGDITISSNSDFLPSWNYFLTLNANDVVELLWSSTGPNTRWVYSPAAINPTRPSTASLIATLNRVDVGGGTNSVSNTIFNAYTSSINSYTASNDTKWSTIQNVTSSILSFTQSLVGTNAWTASIDSKFTTLGSLTGSYATTGSNTFRGNQTLEDAASNASTLVPTSGSFMLVAKTFTSASSHITASTSTQVNLIFKNNSGTDDTIVSGSNNIYVNATGTTAGFKRYIGGNGSVAMGPTHLPQISASMGFSPTMNNNYLNSSNGIFMRGPVSSSAWTISNNYLAGTINLGFSAALNAEKLTGGLNFTANSIQGTFSIIANQNSLTGSNAAILNNSINGGVTLALSSSVASLQNNIVNDSNFTLTNQFFSSSVGLGNVPTNRNNIGGQANQFIITGALPAGTTTANSLSDNFIFGGSNILYVDVANARVSGSAAYINAIRNGLMGNQLIVSGSSLLTDQSSFGSVFVGRYNADDARRNKTSDIVFAVGTGNTGARKTGFLIDSGSNTFVEGTLNVSGSSSYTGSVYGNVVSMSVTSNTASMNLALGNYFELTSSASPLRIELSNLKGGQTTTLMLSASVSTSIAFSSNVAQPSPGAYSGSAAASTDILSFVAFNNSKVNVVATKNIL